jgi:hypothetical protein
MWLRADTNITVSNITGQVTQWSDLTGNGNTASPTSGTSTPIFTTGGPGGNPFVHFDGVSSALSLTNCMASATAGEAFVVLRTSSVNTGTNNGFWNLSGADPSAACYYPGADGTVTDSFGSSIVNRVGIPNQPLSQWHIYNVSAQTGDWGARINGLLQTSSTSNAPYFVSNPQIGVSAGGAAFFGGDIAEVIFFDRELSPAERNVVSSYLNNEYGIVALPPGTPGNLTAAAVSPSQVEVTWTGTSVDNSTTAYTVERSAGVSGTYQAVGSVSDGFSFLDSGLSPGTQYFYEVQASNYAGASALTTPVSATTLTSGSNIPLTGLRLWLRGDTGVVTESNGALQMWLDQSGSNNNAVQATGTCQPMAVPNIVNNIPAIYFDGNRKFLSLPANMFNGMQAGEIVAILRATDAQPHESRGLWNFGNETTEPSSLYPDSNGNITESFASFYPHSIGAPLQRSDWYSVYDISADSSQWTVSTNGTSQFQSAFNTVFFPVAPTVGSATGEQNAFDGEIAEIMVYDHVLSPAERTAITGYLTNKYALAITGTDGLPGWLELLSGSNSATAGPWNPANPGTPQEQIQIVSGDYQYGSVGSYLTNPMVVKVTDTNGVAIPNSSVTFTVYTGGGLLSATGTGNTNGNSITITTGSNGEASTWFFAEPPDTISNLVTGSAGSGSQAPSIVMMEAVSYWCKTSGDDIPDGWKIQYGLNPLVSEATTLDPNGDGLSIGQAYYYGIDPISGGISVSGDGISDGWAAAHGLNPLLNEADAEAGQTGLTNLEEYNLDVSTVGSWSFGEGSGNMVADSSGNGYTGSLEGNPVWTTGTVSGFALLFNGTSNYVTMGQQSAFGFGQGSFTVACRFETSSTTEQRVVSTGGANGQNGYYLGMENGTIVAAVGAGGTSSAGLKFSTANTFNDGQWHHVAAVFDQTVDSAKIYVDGNLQDLTPAPGTTGTAGAEKIVFPVSNSLNASGSGDLTIAEDPAGGFGFAGTINGPALYKIALDAAQVRYICGPLLNHPPHIVITSPRHGSLAQPASALALQVRATDIDGSVVKVQYYDSGVEIGEADSPPFAISWSSPSSGIHSLTARATDNRSATNNSAAVQVDLLSDPNGTGIPSNWELQYFGVDNIPGSTLDQNGVSYLVDYLEGRNPTVPAIAEQDGDIGLTVFTELEQ